MLPNLFFRDIFAHINGGIAPQVLASATTTSGNVIKLSGAGLSGNSFFDSSARHPPQRHQSPSHWPCSPARFPVPWPVRGGNRLLGHAGEFNNGDVRSGA